MKKIALLLNFALAVCGTAIAQNADSLAIRKLYTYALTKAECYQNLDYLCNQIGQRLSGSANAEKAVNYTKKLMEDYSFDKVYLQEVMVPHWERGAKEQAEIRIAKTKTTVKICALGGSVATAREGLKAQIIEVRDLDELKKIGEGKIKGKLVFFNKPMDPTNIETFDSYGPAVGPRSRGAAEAVKYGAVGVIVRSVNPSIDDHPHTGATHYAESGEKIPAAAISTRDADKLSELLEKNPSLEFWMKLNCRSFPDARSYNVIGELRGSEFPEEVIVVGGHLDSWDLGTGAHDDGAGCTQSIEVLRMLKETGIRPRHTIRAVLFMNEENGLRGGYKYAEVVEQTKEKHVAAIESDAGGFTPRGFGIDGSAASVSKIRSWTNLLKPYGLYAIDAGGSGADIGPLKKSGATLIGFRPDSQRYFDIHHAETDVFETINKRELELGAASMAALIYLIDKYGL